MNQIVLTDEQVEVFSGCNSSVVVLAPNGAILGVLDPNEAEDIAIAQARRLQPRRPGYSHAQIQARLQALQAERERIGAFDLGLARSLLKTLEQSDPQAYGPKVAQ